tara:strand:- start:7 stop:222 length:216 start_codon:yes stop_codon:yes gene_type:complete
MIKKLLSYSSYIFLPVFLASSTFYSGVSPVEAVLMNSEGNEDNSISIVIEESRNNQDSSRTTAAPYLGDDQ